MKRFAAQLKTWADARICSCAQWDECDPLPRVTQSSGKGRSSITAHNMFKKYHNISAPTSDLDSRSLFSLLVHLDDPKRNAAAAVAATVEIFTWLMHSMRRGRMPFWRLCLHASVSSFAKSTPAPSYDMSCGEDLFACFENITALR